MRIPGLRESSCAALIPTEVDGFSFVQQPPDLIAIEAVGGLDLPLGEPLQKAAAGLAVCAHMSVDALEQRIGIEMRTFATE